MSRNCKISVIVPVYNSERHLRACIESILRQTEPDFELILVNDGSQDKSAEICDHYVILDQRVQVINQKNMGVSAARNSGIAAASGKYVMFVDSDDIIDPVFLDEAFLDIEAQSADMYISGLSMETWQDNSLVHSVPYIPILAKKYSPKSLLDDFLINYPLICISGPCCKLFRRSLLVDYNIRFKLNLNCGEDTYFNLDFISANPRIFMANKSYYHYIRQNTDSLFSRYKPDIYQIHTTVFDHMRDVMVNSRCSTESLDRFEELYISCSVSCIRHYFEHKEKNSSRERNKIINEVFSNQYLRLKNQPKLFSVDGIVFILGKYKCYWIIYIIMVLLYSKTRKFISKQIMNIKKIHTKKY